MKRHIIEHKINKAKAMARELRFSEGETRKQILQECKAFAVINARVHEASAILHKAITEAEQEDIARRIYFSKLDA